MRISLPDINILIALHDPNHVGHNRSQTWFDAEGKHGWATCPRTENGFVRVLSRIQYPNHVQGVSNALYLLYNMIQIYCSTHHFWPDHVSLSDRTLFNPSVIAGPSQITDVYLLGLCQHNGGALVRLDTGITPTAIVSPHPELLRLL